MGTTPGWRGRAHSKSRFAALASASPGPVTLCTARCRATRASVRARRAPNAWCRQSSLTERERRGEYVSVGALRKQSTALVRGCGAPEWSRAAQRTRESGAKARERLARLVAAVRLYGRMLRAPVRWDRAPNAMKAAEARRRLVSKTHRVVLVGISAAAGLTGPRVRGYRGASRGGAGLSARSTSSAQQPPPSRLWQHRAFNDFCAAGARTALRAAREEPVRRRGLAENSAHSCPAAAAVGAARAGHPAKSRHRPGLRGPNGPARQRARIHSKMTP